MLAPLYDWDHDVVERDKNQEAEGLDRKARQRQEYRNEFLRLWTQLPEGTTQAEIAKVLGINPSNVSKYLSDASDVAPSKQTLLTFGRMYDLPVRLAGHDTTTVLRDNKLHTEEDEAQLVMAIRRAERDPIRRKKLIRILTVLLEEMARPISYKGDPENLDTKPAPSELDQAAHSVLSRFGDLEDGDAPQP